VLVEKPVAGSLEEIARLNAAATRRVCFPSHNYIYDPRLREAKRRLDAGDFGRMSSFWMLYNQKHWANWGSPDVLIRELMIHHAYSAIYFAGKPLRVSCSASNVFFSNSAFPDQAIAVIEHAGGVISNLWGSFGVDDFTSSPWPVFYKVLGIDGAFQMSWNDSDFGVAKNPGWDKAAYRDSFYYVEDYFVNSCVLKGKSAAFDTRRCSRGSSTDDRDDGVRRNRRGEAFAPASPLRRCAHCCRLSWTCEGAGRYRTPRCNVANALYRRAELAKRTDRLCRRDQRCARGNDRF
jgi:hypothetical protein